MLKKIVQKVFLLFGLEISKKPADITAGKFSTAHVVPFQWIMSYNISTVIDIGANEGQFAKKISMVFPSAQIHCFEPLENVYKKLQNTFKGSKHVMTYHTALGERSEEKVMFSNEYSPSSSLLEMLDLHKSNFDFAVHSQPVEIGIRRLDDIFPVCPATPMLLKIDVQGYEMQVLKGADRILESTCIVIIEVTFVPLYKEQPLFEDIYEYLMKRGFRYAGNIEQLLAPIDGQVLQADAIFIRI